MTKHAPCACYPQGNDGDCPAPGCSARPSSALPESGTNNAAGPDSTVMGSSSVLPTEAGTCARNEIAPPVSAPAAPTGETPRTDALGNSHDWNYVTQWRGQELGQMARLTWMTDHARQLERDLAEANRQRVFFQNLAKSNLLDAESAERQLASVQSATQPLTDERVQQARRDAELLGGPFNGSEGLDSFTLAWAIKVIEREAGL